MSVPTRSRNGSSSRSNPDGIAPDPELSLGDRVAGPVWYYQKFVKVAHGPGLAGVADELAEPGGPGRRRRGRSAWYVGQVYDTCRADGGEDLMDEMTRGVFLFQIERQSKFLLMAIAQLEDALSRDDDDGIWFAIQAAVIAAGNLAKLFWPPRADLYAERGRDLRQVLEVDETSTLARFRRLRNRFEHFDEDIEAWAQSEANMVDLSAVPADILFTSYKAQFMRNFDTDTFTVLFGHDRYPLRQLVDEVRAMLERLVKHRGW
jgi:hypothetical protein